MPSSINARHSQMDAETPQKSFIYNASSISDKGFKCSPNASYSSEYLTTTQQSNKSLERACLELFGSHDACMMEAEKRTWELTPASGQDPEYFRFLFAERGEYLPRLSTWQKHNNGTLCIIVRASANRTRWIGYDIDLYISEQELVKKLERVQQLHGVTFTYCRSTGGVKWHVWLFTRYSKTLLQMRHVAALLANELNIKIDKVCPNGKQQITAPFAAHRPLKTTTGRTIAHPAHLPFNDAAIKKLSNVDIKPPKTKQKPVQAISQPDLIAGDPPQEQQQQTFTGNRLWIDDVPQDVRAEMRLAYFNGADIYISAIKKHYPTDADYRQHFVLAVAADLKKLGCTEAEAEKIILDIARRKGDEETNKRTVAIKRTYTKKIVLGFAASSTAMNVRQTFFYSDLNKQGLAKEQRILQAEQRLVTAISLRMSGNSNVLYTAMRPLADNTGMSVKTVRAALKRLQNKGILAAMKLPKKQGTQIQLLKGYQAYEVEQELEKEAAREDIKRVAKNKERHQKETNKDKEGRRGYTDTVVGTHKAEKHVTEASAPAFAAPSDDSQTIVKSTSEAPAPALIVADGDYAEAPAPLANAPP